MKIQRIFVAIVLTLLGVGGYYAFDSGYLTNLVPADFYVENIPVLNNLVWFNSSDSTFERPSTQPGNDDNTTVLPENPTTPVQTAAPIDDPVVTVLDKVTVLIADPVSSLDPYQMVDRHPDGSVSSHIWDTLTILNDDLVVKPHLADSWRIVNNFTWEFHLRPGLVFHNGEPLNAEAVRFSIQRARTLPGSLETFAEDINLKEIEIVDDHTVVLVTNTPIANVPYYFAFLEILPPVYYAETELAELNLRPQGSGPYQFVEIGDKREIILEAMPDYWRGAPYIAELEFQPVSDENERAAMLLIEDVAIATELPAVITDTWQMGDTRVEIIESTRRLFVGMNIDSQTPFSSLAVRKALNYGTDVEAIVDTWLEGYGTRYGSWVNPPNNNSDLEPWPYDPDLAKELLAEAGYGNGFTTTLAIPIGLYEQEANIAQAIVDQWAEIGVEAEIEENDWPLYLRKLLSNSPPPLFLLSLHSHGDGIEDVKNLSYEFPFNPVKWRDPIFEDDLQRAVSTLDRSSRLRRLNDLQEIGYNQAPWVWLWRPFDFYGVSNKLDWHPRRDGIVNLYQPVLGEE